MSIDWNKFTAPDNERLARPYVFGGRRYACDGRLAISVPTSEPDDVTGTWYEDIAKTVLTSPGALLRWPDTGFVEKEEDCVVCDGRRFTDQVRCAACDGRGEVVCTACERPHECERCEGHGWAGGKRCTLCGGRRGPFKHDVYQFVDGRPIMKFVRRITELGGVMYYADGGGDRDPIRFTFAGDGRGAVMPLLLPAAERVA